MAIMCVITTLHEHSGAVTDSSTGLLLLLEPTCWLGCGMPCHASCVEWRCIE